MNSRTLRLMTILLLVAACGSPSAPSPQSTDLDGFYTMRVQSSCQVLPDELRDRSYPVKITGSPSPMIEIGSGRFWRHPQDGLRNRILLTVKGDQITFGFARPGGSFGVIEEVAPGQFFEIVGTGTGERADTIEAALSVRLAYGADPKREGGHVACEAGSSDARVTLTRSAQIPPPATESPGISSLTLEGPSSIDIGRAATFSIRAQMSDGSTRDLTSATRFSGSNGNTAVSGASVTGLRVGFDLLLARVDQPLLGEASIRRPLTVLEPGTFVLRGTVREAGTNLIIVQAGVEVTRGVGAGLKAATAGDGSFNLLGVAGDIELRVTRPGYADRLESLSIRDHTTANVSLELRSPRPDVSGVRRLRIRVSEQCEDHRLTPAELDRTYDVRITQSGRDARMVITSGNILNTSLIPGGTFDGSIEPDLVFFRFPEKHSFTGYGYDGVYAGTYRFGGLIEIIANDRYLLMIGRGLITNPGSSLDGRLDGTIMAVDPLRSAPPFSPQHPMAIMGGCNANDHRFELIR